MKCDELKAIKQGSVELGEYWVYDAEEVDAAIAELKEQYKDMDVTHTEHIAKMNARIDELEDNVAFWKKKLDDEMASRRDEYEKSEKEIRRLKRALWLARANNARNSRRVSNAVDKSNA